MRRRKTAPQRGGARPGAGRPPVHGTKEDLPFDNRDYWFYVTGHTKMSRTDPEKWDECLELARRLRALGFQVSTTQLVASSDSPKFHRRSTRRIRAMTILETVRRDPDHTLDYYVPKLLPEQCEQGEAGRMAAKAKMYNAFAKLVASREMFRNEKTLNVNGEFVAVTVYRVAV